MSWLDEVQFGSTGLIPVVTQDVATGEVLMVAHANREALERTERSGRAHYWSRSRQRLWIKGETSGHIQEVAEIRVDCDGDSVLYRVRQTGPACHTLHRSCFFRAVEDGALLETGSSGHILSRVDEIIADRIQNPRKGAYTNYLLDQGIDKILKKVGEESTEVVIAAKNESVGDLGAETADLLFHLLVMLRARNLDLDAVWKELEVRFGRAPRQRSETSRRNPDA